MTGPPLSEHYREDRTDCLHPDLECSTAYGYGCRCKGCYKHHSAAYYWRKAEPRHRLCATPGCENLRRTTQGARHCETHATSINYQTRIRVERTCCICETTQLIHRDKRLPICARCHDRHTALIQQANAHQMPAHQLAQYANNPNCNLCGTKLYTGRGVERSGFAIDHDHSCCNGGKSCGQCIRGILCHGCNGSLGHVESLIGKATLAGIMNYLGRFLDDRSN